LEVFDQRGIADRFLAEGQRAPVAAFAGVQIDLSGLPTPHPYVLGLRQNHVERILSAWLEELRVPIYRGIELARFEQDDGGVQVDLNDGHSIRCSYLVGCDGGRSVVRKLSGIVFPGTEPTISNLMAEAEFSETPTEWGVRRDAIGTHALSRLDYAIQDGEIVYADNGPVGVLLTEPFTGQSAEPTLADVSAGLVRVYGSDYGIHSPTWISRFTDSARQAASYRQGRILIAGDAAHIHPPDGGQGLQTGVQDAVNLGWKLAQVTKGISPATLLDTYEGERYPVAARVIRHTLASVVLRRDDPQIRALRETLAELLSLNEGRQRFAATIAGLDIRYDVGEGHPLLGRRIPDLNLLGREPINRIPSGAEF
jgi:2-polyprenyl-6-methoxyphenol hydroxylase-like FAD-dependent oxidoreductase